MPRTSSAAKFSRIALSDLVATANETFAERMRALSHRRAFTFVDLLCGGGGSSVGLTEAGGQLMFGANHSEVAIATHARNFPDADHRCVDLNHYDMRNLPGGVDVLWASVICTEVSPAGGKRRRNQALPGQEALFGGDVEEELFERTRATAQDVIRAAELWNFPIVCVENVLEFVTDWKLFAWWLNGFEILGYRWQIMSASSAHLGGEGNEAAAQWRNRVYIVFTRKDLPELDVTPRPEAYCAACDRIVESRQVWKDRGMLTASGKRFQVGEYGQRGGQYFYACPVRGHGAVEPFTNPAAGIIDWTNLGTRIGDRKKPLVANTMGRLRKGVDMVLAGKLSNAWLDANGGSWNTGPAPVTAPFRTRTVSEWEGLVSPPAGTFISTYRKNVLPTSPFEPLTTVTSGGSHHALVIPYRKNCLPTSVGSPIGTISTVDGHGLLSGEEFADIDNWHYRMVSWIEQSLAQRFPIGYEMAGNQDERTMQAGNAVSCNAAHFLGARFARVLAGERVGA